MARTPVITPAAELAAVLAEWHRHRAAIVAAAESGDMAALRRLEEQEVDWLTDIAVAAGSLLGDRVLLEIRVENTYATGENFTRAFIVAVPPPAGGQDPDQWAAEHLLDYTGEGPEYAGVEALYEVEVTVCDACPELVHAAATAQG